MDKCNSTALQTVVVTGASGFVGRQLCLALSTSTHNVRGVLRSGSLEPESCHEIAHIKGLDQPEGWESALDNADIVIHCAGIAHKPPNALNAADDFDRFNRKATIDIAEKALSMGVRRFIFISSVGVYGHIPSNHSACESYPCNPREPYAVSKLYAEIQLTELCKNTAMELVIIRTPMIYGPSCPGNFASLTRFVKTRLPIPLGSIESMRNYVSIFNLTHFISVVCEKGNSASGIYNVADNEEVSLQDTVRLISEGLRVSNRMIKIPNVWLKWAAKLTGKSDTYSKLTESVRISSIKAQTELTWKPPISPSAGIKSAAQTFK